MNNIMIMIIPPLNCNCHRHEQSNHESHFLKKKKIISDTLTGNGNKLDTIMLKILKISDFLKYLQKIFKTISKTLEIKTILGLVAHGLLTQAMVRLRLES